MATIYGDADARGADQRRGAVCEEYSESAEPSASIIRAADGGSLRTFCGGLPHENGWYPSAKARRVLHWEGITQLEFVIRSEVDFNVARLGTECVRFEFPFDGKWVRYTADVELVAPDGSVTIVELKHSPRDLGDDRYKRMLGVVAQICRSNGMHFEIVFKSDIWLNRTHRRNAELCASRRFCSVDLSHRIELEAHAEKTQRSTTLGDLADALAPTNRAKGEAIVMALAAARHLRLDLTRPLLDATHVTIV